MPEPAELEALLRLMPPVTDSDTAVDWDQLAESWGRPFPMDYQRFIAVYGVGMIDDFMGLCMPEPWVEPPVGDNGDMRAGSALARVLWEEERKVPELEGTNPRLIVWAQDSAGDNLCWDATDPDPEKWPVMVYNRGEGVWRRYDCGMVEFLVRHLEGDFPTCPLGDVYLFGRRSAMFLTRTEYMRRLRSGVDPWTGEPDEFAGMYDYG